MGLKVELNSRNNSEADLHAACSLHYFFILNKMPETEPNAKFIDSDIPVYHATLTSSQPSVVTRYSSHTEYVHPGYE